jgi:hypothetical protein
MVAGDANADNQINDQDLNIWIGTFFFGPSYLPADFDLDTFVFTNDYTDYFVPNFMRKNQLPPPILPPSP